MSSARAGQVEEDVQAETVMVEGDQSGARAEQAEGEPQAEMAMIGADEAGVRAAQVGEDVPAEMTLTEGDEAGARAGQSGVERLYAKAGQGEALSNHCCKARLSRERAASVGAWVISRQAASSGSAGML